MAIRIVDGTTVATLASVINEHDDRITDLEDSPSTGGVTSVAGKTGVVTLAKSDVGLGSVDNTSDAAKPVSIAQASAIGTKVDQSVYDAQALRLANTSGTNTGDQDLSGKADLVGGKVPAAQLPSYVDDVLEFNNLAAFPATGETGKIYIAIDTNREYRWSGSIYVQIVASPGTTDNVPEGTANLYFTNARVAASPAVAAATPLFQPETISFATRIKAVGGILDANEVNLVDSFFVKGRNDGWLALMKWIWCPMGSNLASALVNLLATGTIPGTLVNNNFVEADYSKNLGFGTGATSNTNKYLSTGIIPSVQGITPQNVSLGAFAPDESVVTNLNYMSLTPASGTNYLFIQTFPVTVGLGGTGGTSNPGGYGPVFTLGNWGASNVSHGYVNAVNSYDSTTTTTSGAFDTEIVIFKNPTTVYSNGRLGMIVLGNFLSKAQAKSLSDAMMTLAIGLGRYNTVGVIQKYLGDSITLGAGASKGVNRWATITAKNTGAREINFGVGSSQLRLNTLISPIGVTGGFQRYLDMVTIRANVVFCMYGTNDMNNVDKNATGDPTFIADYVTKLTAMVNSWIAERLKVVLLAPPYNALAGTPIARRNAWQAACLQVAVATGVSYVDTENLFTDTPTPATTYFPVDSLHPNDAGHALLAQLATAVYNGKTYRNLNLDFPSIAAGAYADLSVTIYTARVGMTVELGYTATAGIVYQSYVSANDTVIVRAINVSAAAIDLASQAFRVQVTLN